AQPREGVVGGAERVLTRHQIVERAVDRAEAPGHFHIWQDVEEAFAGRVAFGDQDLRKDELEVRSDELNGHGCLPLPARGSGGGVYSKLNTVWTICTANYIL